MISLGIPSDINTRMPRSEAEQIFNMIKPVGKVHIFCVPIHRC